MRYAFFDSLLWRCLLLSFVLAVVLPFGLHAQNGPSAGDSEADFLKATIVTADGDSLKGQIRQWRPKRRTPEVIHFRQGTEESVTTYRPADLKAFTIQDASRRFVSRAVQVDQVPTDPKAATSFLQSDRSLKKPDSLLLEVVVQGPLALHTKQAKRDRYYIEVEDEITELIERTRYLFSKKAVATSHHYRRQLAKHMPGCKKVRTKTETTKLTYRSLQEIVAQYNRCRTGTVSFLAENPSAVSISYGVSGGLVGSQPRTTGSLSINSAYNPKIGYTLGAWMLLNLGNRWTINTQLTYVDENLRGTTSLFIVTIDHKAIRLLTLPRYYIGTTSSNTWRPYLEGGLGLTYSVVFDEQISSEGVERGYLPSDFQRFGYGAVAGVGVAYRSFTVGVRTEMHLGFSNVPSHQFTMLNRSAHIFLGYQF